MKVAIITDSNSGITQEEGKQLGIRIVPMPFMINGEEYLEDITLTQQEFYAKLGEGSDISTSQPSPESIMALWDEVLEEYDEIVHIPMSSGLSGSCQTAMMLAEDYDGKVEVVNNQRISVTQRQSALDAKELAAKGMCAAEIKEKLEAVKFDSSIYITLDTLKYLKKGGRITPAAAALGTMLRLKPVLQIHGEKLDAFAKARTVKQAKNIMIKQIKDDTGSEDEYGMFLIPLGDNTWYPTSPAGPTMFGYKGTEHEDLVREFFNFVTTTESLQEILDNSPAYTNLDVNDDNLEQHWLPEEEEFLETVDKDKMSVSVLQNGTKYTNDYWMQFGQDMIAFCQGEMEANDVLANMDTNRAEAAKTVGDENWE